MTGQNARNSLFKDRQIGEIIEKPKFLLDTNILLKIYLEPEKVSKKIKDIIENPKNRVLVSPISFWEIGIKYTKGTLDLNGDEPVDFWKIVERDRLEVWDPLPYQFATIHNLPEHHKDPFDRLLVWQCINDRDLTLLTTDKTLEAYEPDGLAIVF